MDSKKMLNDLLDLMDDAEVQDILEERGWEAYPPDDDDDEEEEQEE